MPPKSSATAEPPRWIVRPLPRPDATLRLFCFPYAGGGASAFKDWADALPEHIDLCIVQMPGREDRLSEPLITEMPTLIAALTSEIRAYCDIPFAFFGHSMGAIVSYEVARHLRALGAPQPAHLFVSARAAPQLENIREPLRDLDNAHFIDRLHQAYGAVPDAIRNSAELQKVFLPILRADVALLETYQETATDPLDCPVTALGGTDDPAITPAMLAGWQKRTTAAFAQHDFAGDHFYINDQRAAVIAAINAALDSTP